jgi:hypothetical protein
MNKNSKRSSSSSHKSHHHHDNVMVHRVHKVTVELDPSKMVQIEGDFICYKRGYSYFQAALIYFILGSLFWVESMNMDENKNKKFHQLSTFPWIVLLYVLTVLNLVFVFIPPSATHPMTHSGAVFIVFAAWIIWFLVRLYKK